MSIFDKPLLDRWKIGFARHKWDNSKPMAIDERRAAGLRPDLYCLKENNGNERQESQVFFGN
jgi:hypothetical protein